ncbi:hypothetical protein DL98DRAFT_608755 [Cadophora sp. DSE1049]|nr:hypothetical protein DL98DRAFT_608755 [Cadophora sp. DSE1049]
MVVQNAREVLGMVERDLVESQRVLERLRGDKDEAREKVEELEIEVDGLRTGGGKEDEKGGERKRRKEREDGMTGNEEREEEWPLHDGWVLDVREWEKEISLRILINGLGNRLS